ncbi:serpin family protein [Alkalinema sp. FACHB-956]|uniref:serpin family protein n=1 Tax=Alkalinema sp. FACHB-956 TaxID=2692768 RepID=UPI0016860F06|nr:serpin family protein [Alkalinema sp. FACHB-956]MBD2327650.1 serpin family protein [Alkalinema sp. FACHB-956]
MTSHPSTLLSTALLTLWLGVGMVSCSQAAPIPSLPGSPSSMPRPSQASPTRPVASPSPTPSTPAKPVNPKLIAANNRFSFNLLAAVRQQDRSRNVFISPSSVAIALSMLYNGAAGETQKAMAEALQLQDLSLDAVNAANETLKTRLESDNAKVKLTIANSLWLKQGMTFNPEFLSRNQRFYQAKVASLDFADPQSPQVMNNWVKRNTNGRIEKIVDRLNPQDVLYLMNAIYFKGSWEKPFNKQQTREQPFRLANGQTKPHPMMQQFGKYSYAETEDFQAISLPYSDRRLSLYVFLPKEGKTLDALADGLTAETWERWQQQFGKREGSIVLPKFKLEYDTELKDALTTLGMKSAFIPGVADFRNLSDRATFIGQVKHKTFVEVNEEGTEAAGVTSIGIRTTSIPQDPPFQMVVDRPFFCALYDSQTGTILFMGTIVDPSR